MLSFSSRPHSIAYSSPLHIPHACFSHPHSIPHVSHIPTPFHMFLMSPLHSTYFSHPHSILHVSHVPTPFHIFLTSPLHSTYFSHPHSILHVSHIPTIISLSFYCAPISSMSIPLSLVLSKRDLCLLDHIQASGP